MDKHLLNMEDQGQLRLRTANDNLTDDKAFATQILWKPQTCTTTAIGLQSHAKLIVSFTLRNYGFSIELYSFRIEIYLHTTPIIESQKLRNSCCPEVLWNSLSPFTVPKRLKSQHLDLKFAIWATAIFGHFSVG